MNKNIRNTTQNVGLIVFAVVALIALQAMMTPKKKTEKYCSACSGK